MSRRFALICVICASAIMAAIDRTIRVIDSAVRFILSSVSPAPAFAFASSHDETWGGTRLTFSDPHIERHEAGQSRRAAARGI